MLTFIYDASVTALGFTLAMTAWYFIGAILVTIFNANTRNTRVLKNPKSPTRTALFVLLVSMPACHLYNSAVARIVYGQ
nr:MAG TPA: hypothetical protein [Caudoviricetes sp.]